MNGERRNVIGRSVILTETILQHLLIHLFIKIKCKYLESARVSYALHVTIYMTVYCGAAAATFAYAVGAMLCEHKDGIQDNRERYT